jgi:hypothetical protein
MPSNAPRIPVAVCNVSAKGPISAFVKHVASLVAFFLFIDSATCHAAENPFAGNLKYYSSIESVIVHLQETTKIADPSAARLLGLAEGGLLSSEHLYASYKEKYAISDLPGIKIAVSQINAFNGEFYQKLESGMGGPADGVLQIWRPNGNYTKKDKTPPISRALVGFLVAPIAPIGFEYVDLGNHGSLYETLQFHLLSKEFVARQLAKLDFRLESEDANVRKYVSGAAFNDHRSRKIHYRVETQKYPVFADDYLVSAWEKVSDQGVVGRFEFEYDAIKAPDKMNGSSVRTFAVPSVKSKQTVFDPTLEKIDGATTEKIIRLEINRPIDDATFLIDSDKAKKIIDQDTGLEVER